MASSSSFLTDMIPQNKYDVFLSFRGEDTRDNFTSHLYEALRRQQVVTFIDNQLIRGDEISQSLLNAIEESNISIIIFSERYASSRWCLDELIKILECKNKYGQIVIPVFYRVDPSDVRNQTGIFGDSLLKLEERFQGRLDKLQRWRTALREAANLSGFDSHVIRLESVLIEKIVEDILRRLNDMFPSDLYKDLVGVESHIKEIESLLSYGVIDVYTLGVWGIGGIGKTTIASVIFKKISNYFDGSYFIQNVREESEKIGGLAHLRRKLFSTLLGDRNLSIGIPSFGIQFESKRLSRKKVLIVFDDVTCFQQIESVIGSLDWFMPGSLIIVTTRNKQVLRICGMKKIYEMKKLVDSDALTLFSRQAFGENHPDEVYKEFSKKVIQYAQGVPLALKVLGRFLFGRSKEDWESAINKLKRIPHMDIQKVLKISYDGLDDEEQNIFLDIACFFKGEDRDLVINFLNGSGFSAEIGITILVDKSLVIISNNKIAMHDLVEKMGKEIVRQESAKNPGKRSRLWHHDDVFEVLTKNKGTEAIEGISLDMSQVNEIHLNPDTFSKMHNLRFIKFYSPLHGDSVNKVHHFEDLKSVFSELRYLHWRGYPLNSLPSIIDIKNLVVLEFSYSNIEQLWDGVQSLVNLKQIDLRYSRQLRKLPDLSQARNLEKLILQGCSSLAETHPSIQYLKKLVVLNLKSCRSLKSLSTNHLEHLEQLHLSDTAIKELPSSIEFLSRLFLLNLEYCSRLQQLPRSICKLKSLEYIYLSGCSNLQRLPDELGNLDALRVLDTENTAIREIPSSIVCLNNLDEIYFNGFRGHEQMGFLWPISLSLNGLHSLTILSLIDCGVTELPESLGQLSSVEYLYLDKNNFERIPESIINLSKLDVISLRYCKGLQSLPKFPCSLEFLLANDCTSLEVLSGLSVLFTLRMVSKTYQDFDMRNCFKLDRVELKKIVEDALQKIQLIATTWWKNQNLIFLRRNDFICYPGSDIPEWFKFQSMGSSINLELPPDDILIGFAVCATVAFEDHHNSDRTFNMWCSWKVKDEIGKVIKNEDAQRCGYSDDSFRVGKIGYVESDHVFLGYHLSTQFLGYSNEAFIQFYVDDLISSKRIDSCPVKKCGIHLLYPKDFEKSKKNGSRPFSSSTDEEEESYLHPKRSKNSTSSF